MTTVYAPYFEDVPVKYKLPYTERIKTNDVMVT